MHRYKIGDLVWLYTPTVKIGSSVQLADPWRGPYEVVRQSSWSMLAVRSLDGQRDETLVHAKRLKFYTPDENSQKTTAPRPVVAMGARN